MIECVICHAQPIDSTLPNNRTGYIFQSENLPKINLIYKAELIQLSKFYSHSCLFFENSKYAGPAGRTEQADLTKSIFLEVIIWL